MKICCWINFEMHFKSNSDKLHEQAFPKIYFQNKYAAYLFTNTRILYKNTNIANTKQEGDDKGDRSVCILIS